MKLLIITADWIGGGGGVVTFLRGLINELRAKNMEVSIVYRNGNDTDNYKVTGNIFLFPFKAYLASRKEHPEVVNSYGNWYCLIAGFLFKFFNGSKLVCTFHTQQDKKLPLFASYFLKSLLSSCDEISFVSNGLKKNIEWSYNARFDKGEITYPGITPRRIDPEETKRFLNAFGLDESRIILLAQAMTAHPLKAQGLKILIRSVQLLRKTYPNILLIVTREGEYSDDLKAFARECGVEEQVVFTGDVDNPFVPLELCDIYTHITLGDGLPLSLLEAMAMGKPIIATPVGGIPEAVTNEYSGLLVDPTPEAVASALFRLIEDKELSETLGKNARQTVEEKFTWEKSAKKLLDIYTRT